jgi:hypothetical protein
MPIDLATQNQILMQVAQVLGIPESTIRFNSSETDGKTVVTLVAQKIDPEGQTTDTQLQISNADKPMRYLLNVKIISPNKTTDFSKVLACSPQQIPILIKNMLLVQKVCKKNPHIIRRLGNKLGSYV